MRTMRTNIESPAPKQWEPKLFKGGISCWFVSLFNQFATHNIHVCSVLAHVAKPFIEIGRSSMDQIVTPISTSVHLCNCVIVYFCIFVQVKERQWIKLTPPSLDLGDGQFSERCDVDGSFFNSDAIPIIFGKA